MVMLNLIRRKSVHTPIKDFETKVQNRKKLVTLLKQLSSAKTWEGVNKHNAKAVFETYAIKIEELFAETYYKDK